MDLALLGILSFLAVILQLAEELQLTSYLHGRPICPAPERVTCIGGKCSPVDRRNDTSLEGSLRSDFEFVSYDCGYDL